MRGASAPSPLFPLPMHVQALIWHTGIIRIHSGILESRKIPESHHQIFRVVDPLPWIKLGHLIVTASMCTNKPMLSLNNMMLLIIC